MTRNYHRLALRVRAAKVFFEPSLSAVAVDTTTLRPVWHRQAACRGHLELFFAEVHSGQTYDRAAELCSRCEVSRQCDAEAEELAATVGYYGFRAGLSPRARLRRRRTLRTNDVADGPASL